jgi:hypothetical protein
VQSVNGLSGQTGSSTVDWFYFVNGSEGSKGSASVRVREGDSVWWDRHDWGAAMDVPAVVGSFPEPFLHGLGGKRLPVRIECSPADTPGCKRVSDLLGKAGVVAARGGLAASFTKETLRILVGLWPAIHEDPAARQIERGPQTSGVFARPARDGRSLALLDGQGGVVRTLGAGAGLVAATSVDHGRPVWVVTGTDVRGLTDAAESLQSGVLRNRFALVTDQGRPLSAPERCCTGAARARCTPHARRPARCSASPGRRSAASCRTRTSPSPLRSRHSAWRSPATSAATWPGRCA